MNKLTSWNPLDLKMRTVSLAVFQLALSMGSQNS
ncbi:Protein of unknown function [Pyronema omphalodes CBS 100304]|uniref:Uncharacterized protein n=1 Tax=Pyronema omphalodes (strain CBS 100304) TaxID=1076935 RepID=U4LVJ2_PYROM|nr:Protein of unknown function [Pyronema omphalodes CBS 100304]